MCNCSGARRPGHAGRCSRTPALPARAGPKRWAAFSSPPVPTASVPGLIPSLPRAGCRRRTDQPAQPSASSATPSVLNGGRAREEPPRAHNSSEREFQPQTRVSAFHPSVCTSARECGAERASPAALLRCDTLACHVSTGGTSRIRGTSPGTVLQALYRFSASQKPPGSC